MNPSANETGSGITVACKVHFKPGAQGRRRLRQGEAPVPPAVEPGHVPRLARLLALRPIACAEHAKRQPIALLWE